jgi:hypothetical protein
MGVEDAGAVAMKNCQALLKVKRRSQVGEGGGRTGKG